MPTLRLLPYQLEPTATDVVVYRSWRHFCTPSHSCWICPLVGVPMPVCSVLVPMPLHHTESQPKDGIPEAGQSLFDVKNNHFEYALTWSLTAMRYMVH